MGCCSSIEIDAKNLAPYGPWGFSFLPRTWRACKRLNEMVVYRRHARAIDEIVARLTADRNACTRQLRLLQVEVSRHSADADKHDRNGDRVLRDGSLQEKKRVQRSARRIMIMRSLADLLRNNAVEETISKELMCTLEQYSSIPIIQLDRSRVSQIVETVQTREALTTEQTRRFGELLADLDANAEVEDEELALELADPSVGIRPRVETPSEILARLPLPPTTL